jgi:hypothetical protein
MRDLMPEENPSKIYCTPDNIEWTFLQTFSSYDRMQKFRRKNKCQSVKSNAKWCRIRFHCNGQYNENQCKFMLLAMKTTNQGYHIYTHGKHNHPIIKSK